VLGGGSDDATTSNAGATTPATGQATTPAGSTTTAPAETAVAVLNGTTITGLARNAADKLQANKYDVVRVTDAADQAQQTSQVAYADGFDGTARRIARLVGISSSEVQPLDASTRAVAGDNAVVVVTMGADKAQ